MILFSAVGFYLCGLLWKICCAYDKFYTFLHMQTRERDKYLNVVVPRQIFNYLCAPLDGIFKIFVFTLICWIFFFFSFIHGKLAMFISNVLVSLIEIEILQLDQTRRKQESYIHNLIVPGQAQHPFSQTQQHGKCQLDVPAICFFVSKEDNMI